MKIFNTYCFKDSSTPSYHSPNGRLSSSSSVNFLLVGSVNTQYVDTVKIKAHGCLMVIAWVFALTGILFARYYKETFLNFKLCNIDFWFVIHRPLMIVVSLVSIVALILILVQLDWKWLTLQSGSVSFSHSLFGIITISFSVIQVIMGTIRPDKDSKYRHIFNIAHRIIGLLCMLFAIVTLFLGVNIERMNLSNGGWIILVLWSISVIFVPVLILELLKFKRKQQISLLGKEELRKKRVTVLETTILIIHTFAELILVIALTTLIGIADVK